MNTDCTNVNIHVLYLVTINLIILYYKLMYTYTIKQLNKHFGS